MGIYKHVCADAYTPEVNTESPDTWVSGAFGPSNMATGINSGPLKQ